MTKKQLTTKTVEDDVATLAAEPPRSSAFAKMTKKPRTHWYTHLHTHFYSHTHLHRHTHTFTVYHILENTPANTLTHIFKLKHPLTHTHTHLCILATELYSHSLSHTHTHTHTHTLVHTHRHKLVHTHLFKLKQQPTHTHAHLYTYATHTSTSKTHTQFYIPFLFFSILSLCLSTIFQTIMKHKFLSNSYFRFLTPWPRSRSNSMPVRA